MAPGDYPLIEDYLADLRRHLRWRWVPERRILDEVAAHLVDAADQARANGRSHDEAQREALPVRQCRLSGGGLRQASTLAELGAPRTRRRLFGRDRLR
jgi:hypothetical protein